MRQENLSLPTVRKVLNGVRSRALGPDIVEGIRRIKSHDGPDLILSGSSTLTSTLLEHGLPDEVLLAVYPVPVGHGEALLCGGNPATLIRARQYESNAVRHHPQYLQGRRAFEDRIVRSRRTPSDPLSTRSPRIPQQGLFATEAGAIIGMSGVKGQRTHALMWTEAGGMVEMPSLGRVENVDAASPTGASPASRSTRSRTPRCTRGAVGTVTRFVQETEYRSIVAQETRYANRTRHRQCSRTHSHRRDFGQVGPSLGAVPEPRRFSRVLDGRRPRRWRRRAAQSHPAQRRQVRARGPRLRAPPLRQHRSRFC